jgi:hypothetical protein
MSRWQPLFDQKRKGERAEEELILVRKQIGGWRVVRELALCDKSYGGIERDRT